MDKTGKAYRITAIIFMGMTAAMNVLGGAGTSCAAFSNNVGYRLAFKELLDYRWLYQGLVVTTILIGIAGVWATVKLVQGGPNVYRNVLIILVIGVVLSGIQYYASMSLRGKAAPANVKFYINAFTFLLFLLFLVPGIKEKVDFSTPISKAEKAASAGAAAFITGIITLTVFTWAGPTHTFFGENWVYVFYWPIIVSGGVLTIGGMGALIWAARQIIRLDSVSRQFHLLEEVSG
jgi:hypothetical protein